MWQGGGRPGCVLAALLSGQRRYCSVGEGDVYFSCSEAAVLCNSAVAAQLGCLCGENPRELTWQVSWGSTWPLGGDGGCLTGMG